MKPDTSRPPILELFLLGLLALLWGGSYPLITVAVETIPPLTLVAIRVSIAAALLWAVVLVRHGIVPIPKKQWPKLFLQACYGSIVPFYLITWAQQDVDSSLAAILNSTSPIFVFLITLVWTRHETVTRGRLFGVFAGFCGTAMIIGVSALAGLGDQVLGQLAIVLATACYGMAAIHGRNFVGMAPERVAAATMSCATAALVPACLIFEDPLSVTPSTESVAALVTLAALSTAAALMIYYRLVGTLGSLGVASVAYLRTGVGVVLGIVLLGEAFHWTTGAGLAAVLMGVAAINGQIGGLRGARPADTAQTSAGAKR